MVLYVVRHGEAVEANGELVDEWRYLTGKGAKSAEVAGSAIAEHGPKPRLIITSPLVRAVQTAQIMAQYANRKNDLIVSGLLQNGSDLDELAQFVRNQATAKRVMVVGHEPLLGSLVAALLGKHDSVQLAKSACVALKLKADAPDQPADFLWYLVPGRKPVSSFKKAFLKK